MWGTFEISNLIFLKTKLDNNNFDICKTEWNIYFTLHFEPFKHYQEPEVASFWNKVLKWTEANKLSMQEKLSSETSCSRPQAPSFPSSFTPLLRDRPLEPACYFSITHGDGSFHSVGLKHGSYCFLFGLRSLFGKLHTMSCNVSEYL